MRFYQNKDVQNPHIVVNCSLVDAKKLIRGGW